MIKAPVLVSGAHSTDLVHARWAKMGRIFVSDGRYPWMHSHNQNPAVLVLEDRLRVYFNCRGVSSTDGMTTAYATFVDLDRADPQRVLYVHDAPILPLGEIGTFDQFGVMAGSVLAVGKQVWIYYVGWNRAQGVPYNHAIGLAISDDNGKSFRRFALGPILARTPAEPFIQNSPFVAQANSTFRMWYSSGVRWIEEQGRLESIYVIMQAQSPDGIAWNRDGVPCIPPVVEHECQTNPTVVRLGDRWHMWFCYRHGLDFRNAGRGYRIGHAWSDDENYWHRDDSIATLPPSASGWDGEMVCYPCVLDLEGVLTMFYSGNHFGRDGFGYAVLDQQR